MPGFFGFKNNEICSGTALPAPIGYASKNLLTEECEWREQDYRLTSVRLKNSPLTGSRLHTDNGWIGLFSGDLIGYEKIPWQALLSAIETGNTGLFATLNGAWALAIINRSRSTVYLVSDRRSQHPLFYDFHNKQLRFSTELSAFCRLRTSPSFNVNWLYEFLFFHFPIGSTTFLTDVQRLPPACILEYDLSRANAIMRPYCKPLQAQASNSTEKKILERSLEIFSSRIPAYAPKQTRYAAAVTGGWDARTILAFCINTNPITYTYGIPGCGDLVATRDAARKLGIEHREILLDQDFTNQLSHLMFDTVFLSDGLENCFRSSLLYVYRTLTEEGNRFPAILSGIGLDSMFRGHLGPALVSPDMNNFFSGEPTAEFDTYWKSLVLNHTDFHAHNHKSVKTLFEKYGSPTAGSTHLLYFLYEIAPKYYGGEINVARHFTSLRIPALDHEIAALSLRSVLGTLSFSNFLPTHRRGDYTEEILQAYLLANSPNRKFRSLPICGVPPSALLHGRASYNIQKILFKLRGRLQRLRSEHRIHAPLEQNVDWYKTILRAELQELLFSENTRITEYLRLPPLAELATTEKQHLFKKLLSAEIVLRLVDNHWQRFW